jgi:hypothetical protein
MALFMVACERAPELTAPTRAPAKPSSQAIISQTNEKDVPWAIEEQNPCNGDNVVTEGSTHFLMHFGFNDDGTYHIDELSSSKGTGIGVPSLGTYKVSEQFNYSEQNPSGDQFVVRQEERLLILAPKSADNYIRHMIFKFSADQNGVPTVDFESSFTKCVG